MNKIYRSIKEFQRLDNIGPVAQLGQSERLRTARSRVQIPTGSFHASVLFDSARENSIEFSAGSNPYGLVSSSSVFKFCIHFVVMEDLLTDPENLKYGAAVASAALTYGAHRLKSGKISDMTTSEIEMYLDGDNTDFEPSLTDIPYLKAEKFLREGDKEYDVNKETSLMRKIRP